VQLDEKWSFVAQKEKHCDPAAEADLFRGDQWDHVALDADTRLVLSVVVGRRLTESVELLVEDVRKRLGGRAPALVTSDEYAPYADVLLGLFGREEAPPRTGRPGRPAGPRVVPPEGMTYATVHKAREGHRVVRVEERVVFGELPAGAKVSTSYLERQHGTDRHRNARKARRTYRFSKSWDVHAAMTAYTLYSYNFCWPVRTLRQRGVEGVWRQRTPAMATDLTDHIWTLQEWVTLPAAAQH
jgi:IS1 family transposase